MRPYVKWDAQPGSPAAAREALFQAAWLAGMGPTYVNLDAAVREAGLGQLMADAVTFRFLTAPMGADQLAMLVVAPGIP